MAKKERKMPSSQGGLVRYFDDYEQSFEFRPKWVLGGVISLITLVIYLNYTFTV